MSNIQISTLEKTEIPTILAAFNLAFSDYLIPLHLTLEQFERKMQSENIQRSYSVGAFLDGQLIAFVLHGIHQSPQKTLLYNAGTGVIPEYRGQQWTVRLYDYLLPVLRQQSVAQIQLEVIRDNIPALKTYQKIGFRVQRTLLCYHGTLPLSAATKYSVQKLSVYNWPRMTAFWDVQPSWQNHQVALSDGQDHLCLLGVHQAKKLIGYAVFDFLNAKILQMAVLPAWRRKGVGSELLHYIARTYGPQVRLINVPDMASHVVFLENFQLTKTIEQFEMILVL